jgi:hypothetical protein
LSESVLPGELGLKGRVSGFFLKASCFAVEDRRMISLSKEDKRQQRIRTALLDDVSDAFTTLNS